MSLTSRDQPLQPGAIVDDRYEVIRLLRREPEGELYRARVVGSEMPAWELSLEPRPEPGTASARARRLGLLRELIHPNLVPVREVGVDPGTGRLYAVEPSREGRELLAVLPEQEPDRLAELLADSYRGLAFLHRRGWSHPDLGPHRLTVAPTEPLRLGGVAAVTELPAREDPEAVRADDLHRLGLAWLELLTSGGDRVGPTAEDEGQQRLWELVLRLADQDSCRRPADGPAALELIREAGFEVPKETGPGHRAHWIHGPMVARGDQERLLDQSLDTLQHGGRAQLVLLRGEAGSGRSRLLREGLLRAAVQGIACVRVHPPGEARPYGGLLDALDRLAAHLPMDSTERTTEILERLRSGSPEQGSRLAPEDHRQQVLHDTLTVVEEVLRHRSILLALDSPEQLDESSLELLTLVPQLLPSSRLALWVELPPARTGRPALDALPFVPEAVQISASLLTMEQTEDLLRSRLEREEPDRTFVGLIHSRTRGSPLLVLESLAVLAEKGRIGDPVQGWSFPPGALIGAVPESLEGLLERRLARRSEGERKMAAVLALLPTGESLDLLVTLMNLPLEEARRALDGLTRIGWVRPGRPGSAETFRLAHPIYRQILEGLLEPGELEAVRQGRVESLPPQAPTQQQDASILRSIQARREEALELAGQGRPLEAEEILEEALEAARTAGLVAEELRGTGQRAELLAATDRAKEAWETWSWCRLRAKELGLPALEHDAFRGLEVLARRAGRPGEAERLALEALRRAERLMDRSRLAQTLCGLAGSSLHFGRIDEGIQRCRRGLSLIPEGGGTGVTAEIHQVWAALEGLRGRFGEALRHAGTARHEYQRRSAMTESHQVLLLEARLLAELGDPEEARRKIQAAEEAPGPDRALSQAVLSLVLDRWEREGEAQTELDRALEILDGEAGSLAAEIAVSLAAVRLGRSDWARNRLAEMERCWPVEAISWLDRLRWERALVDLADSIGERRTRQARVQSMAEQVGARHEEVTSLLEGGDAALRMGRSGQAREVYGQALQAARQLAQELPGELARTYLESGPVARALAEGTGTEAGAREKDLTEAFLRAERQMIGLHATLDPEETFRRVADGVIAMVGAERALVFLGGKTDPAPVMARSADSRDLDLTSAFRRRTAVKSLLEKGNNLTLSESGLELWLPLGLEGTAPIGLILCEEVRSFRPERDGPLLQLFAQQAATAIVNARLHRQVLTERHRAQELFRLVRDLTTPGCEDDLLHRITARAVELIEAQRGVLLLKPDEGGLKVEVALDAGGRRLDPEHLRLSLSTAHEVAVTGAPRAFLDYGGDEEDPRATDSIVSLDLKQVLCIPIQTGGRVLGVLYLDSTLRKDQGYTEEQIQLVGAFSHAAAVALLQAMMMKELERSLQQQMQQEELQRDFVEVVSHELNTPISILQGFLEILSLELGEDCSPEAAEALERVSAAVERLAAATAAVVNIARFGREAPHLERSPALLEELAAEVAQELEPIARERKLTLTLRPPEEPVRALVDREELGVALRNLVMNAIRFTPDGGSITIWTARSGDQARIAVQDTGIGVPPDQQEQIFEPFYEVEDGIHHSSGTFEFRSAGLGLGLAVVQGILTAHGGSVELESREGRGSTFTLVVPVE